MTTGYFIRQGDKTSCGGQVLEADTRVMMFGIPHCREGDRVSCGKHNGVYKIISGVPYMRSHGRLVAGSLDSVSSCPCSATLIPSAFTANYRSANPAPLGQARTAPQSPVTSTQPISTPRTHFASQSAASPLLQSSATPQEPGFYIVPRSMSRQQLEASLFESPSAQVLEKFRTLNSRQIEFKAGSMIVLSDPQNYRCTREEAQLMSAASAVQTALVPLSTVEADFMMKHRDEISGFLGYASTSVGIGEVVFAKHIKTIQTVLEDIEKLHRNAYNTHGHLRSAEFFAERKRLLGLLDTNLTSLTKSGIGFPDHPNLKHALGLSSRSLVHHWSKAGAAGQIDGYATHINGVATASKLIKAGGWIGTGLGATASYLKVREVCEAGETDACKRVKFTETGGFVGSLGGGIGGGIVSAHVASSICAGLGLVSAGAGTIVCGLVVVGAGSYVAGFGGTAGGSYIGELIYKLNN